MKSIATINFKGGVGKTTITWLMAKYMADYMGKKVLVVDTDAQMSLTLAVEMQDSGNLPKEFSDWYENLHKAKNKTLLDALDKYDNQNKGCFDFPIDNSFIYKKSDNLYFIPSCTDLYWLELDVIDRDKVKYFIHALLGKIANNKSFAFDYVFFDCPPNFTALSYSVLSCANLILIPVNPDIFAARGVGMMVDGLRYRIENWPKSKMAVFMNRAKERLGNMTVETSRFWIDTQKTVTEKSKDFPDLVALNSFIPERVNIKRAIPSRSFPAEYAVDFQSLAKEIEHILT